MNSHGPDVGYIKELNPYDKTKVRLPRAMLQEEMTRGMRTGETSCKYFVGCSLEGLKQSMFRLYSKSDTYTHPYVLGMYGQKVFNVSWILSYWGGWTLKSKVSESLRGQRRGSLRTVLRVVAGSFLKHNGLYGKPSRCV